MGDDDKSESENNSTTLPLAPEPKPVKPVETQQTKPEGPPNTVFRSYWIIDTSKDKR